MDHALARLDVQPFFELGLIFSWHLAGRNGELEALSECDVACQRRERHRLRAIVRLGHLGLAHGGCHGAATLPCLATTSIR
jgi:hypothetical protein